MNRIYVLVFMLGLSLNSFAWGWTARDAVRQSSENPSYFLGDYVSFAWDLNSTGWGATYKKAGIGTTNTSAGINWLDIVWVDEAGDGFGNNEGVTNSSAKVTSTGTWYYSLWLGWGASVGDNGRWYNGNSNWTEGSGTFISSSFTVNALNNPSSQTATTASSSSINLNWSKNAQNQYVMILRKKSTDSWTEPTQGTVYSVGAAVGSATVIYFSNGTSFTSASLTSSTGYDYKFYSENNGYYSAGVVASATTASEAGDYFRSKADGNWNSTGTWESSDDNSAWVNATLSPSSSAGNVVINHAITVSTDETVSSITINSSKSLTINSGKSLNVTGNFTMAPDSFFDIFMEGFCTVGGSLTNNGIASNLKIHSDATGTGSLITTSSPLATVERYMSEDDYHYISAPVASQNVSPEFVDFSGAVPTDVDFYTWDETKVLSWINSKATTSTWNGTFDSQFGLCKGYVYANASTAVTKNFSGTLNAGNKTINLTKSPAGQRGWNLIGNPFASTVAVNNSADATNNLLAANAASIYDTYEAIYLWDQLTAYTVTHTTNEYKAVNQASPATFLSPGQAFMVSASSNNVSFAFPQATRKHGAATFYKSSEMDEVSRFWLNVEAPQGNFNETMVAMIPGTTNGLDIGYDAKKLKGNTNLALYTRLVDGSEGDYAIQSIDQLSGNFVVPVGLDANLTGNYTFKAGRMDNLEAVTVQLEDRNSGTFTTLSNGGEYSIAVGTTGAINNRFFLHLKSTVGIDDPTNQEASSVYASGNKLFIQNPGKALLEVFAITGQKLVTSQINTTGLFQTTLNQPTGYYIVRLTSNGNTQVSKIFIQ